MNIYLDFEATQFKENVIAIGASCEYGCFDCLVHPPKGDKITKFISKLTGITREMSEFSLSPDEAMNDFYEWLMEITKNYNEPTFFHVFGNMDKIFLKNLAQHITNKQLQLFAENLTDSLIDDSNKVCKYFHTKAVGVYKALRYFYPNLGEQDHDPLNDAIALQKLMLFISYAPPLEENPFEEEKKVSVPKKTIKDDEFTGFLIAAKRTHTAEAKYKYYNSFNQAADFISKQIRKDNPEATNKTIHKNLKRAIRTNNTYARYHWKLIKEEDVE